jgi:hypothetical protein
MDCDGKFRNPIRSMKIIRKISDFLRAERGLSIVENPQPSRGSYRDWQDKKESLTNRDKLTGLIDSLLSAGMAFEQFIGAMAAAGCEVKRGRYLSIKIPGAERFIRVKSLGDDYTEEALRERCSGKRVVKRKSKTDDDVGGKITRHMEAINNQHRQNLLIDIQAQIAKGAGDGYVHWMKTFNLKTAARTLIFLKEHGIDSYDELVEKSDTASAEFHQLSARLKEIGNRQKEITEMQKHIGNYGKTRDVYLKYTRSGQSEDFLEIHRAEIIRHEGAKRYFDELGLVKIPSINSLKQEWAKLNVERRRLHSGYKIAKERFMSISTAKANADVILFGERQAQKPHNKDAR